MAGAALLEEELAVAGKGGIAGELASGAAELAGKAGIEGGAVLDEVELSGSGGMAGEAVLVEDEGKGGKAGEAVETVAVPPAETVWSGRGGRGGISWAFNKPDARKKRMNAESRFIMPNAP